MKGFGIKHVLSLSLPSTNAQQSSSTSAMIRRIRRGSSPSSSFGRESAGSGNTTRSPWGAVSPIEAMLFTRIRTLPPSPPLLMSAWTEAPGGSPVTGLLGSLATKNLGLLALSEAIFLSNECNEKKLKWTGTLSHWSMCHFQTSSISRAS